MKKLIIITSIVVVIIAAAIAAYLYFASFQKVTITLHPGVASVKVYQTSGDDDHESSAGPQGKDVQTITSSQTISLTKGKYFLIPKGDHISDNDIIFTVADQPVTVDVNPDYTSDFLGTKLTNEEAVIKAAITSQFPLAKNQYDIQDGSLYKKGEWYGALLIHKGDDPSAPGDYYRVVVRKDGSTWKVIKQPELILTTAEFSNVPSDVIDAVNKLTL